MQVPLLDLRLQYAPMREDVLSALTRACDSQQFIMGPEVDRLESEVAAVIGVPHAIEFSSGTDALIVALMAPLDAFPNADAAASDVLALPIYPELTREQQQYVVARIAEHVA